MCFRINIHIIINVFVHVLPGASKVGVVFDDFSACTTFGREDVAFLFSVIIGPDISDGLWGQPQLNSTFENLLWLTPILPNKQHPSIEYFNKFIVITNEWHKNNSNLKSLQLTINDLINLINNLCNKYITENIVDEMAVEIIPVLEEIKFIIMKWNIAKNGTVERITMQANDLKAEYESLMQVIAIFKKQKIKKSLKII